MNDEWLEWTRSNLARGCDANEIRAILQSHGFAPGEISAAMNPPKVGLWARLKQRLGLAPAKPAAATTAQTAEQHSGATDRSRVQDYAALARTRICSNPRARKVDDARAQIYLLDDFLSARECEQLVALINSNLRPSTITTGKDYTGFRTSSTCDLGHLRAPIVGKVDKKIAAALGIRLPYSETNQGQKYQIGQEFKAHTDYFEPHTKEFDRYAGELGQRTWTFMVYLNTTPKGGATHFTKLDQTFYPKRGLALIWNNLLEDGTPNPFTLHHGMPVEEGEKYIITKWFRDKGKGPVLFPVRDQG